MFHFLFMLAKGKIEWKMHAIVPHWCLKARVISAIYLPEIGTDNFIVYWFGEGGRRLVSYSAALQWGRGSRNNSLFSSCAWDFLPLQILPTLWALGTAAILYFLSLVVAFTVVSLFYFWNKISSSLSWSETSYAAEHDLKCLILLPPPHACWDTGVRHQSFMLC